MLLTFGVPSLGHPHTLTDSINPAPELYEETGEDKDRMRARTWISRLLSREVSSVPLLEATAPLSGPSPTKHFLYTVLVTKGSFCTLCSFSRMVAMTQRCKFKLLRHHASCLSFPQTFTFRPPGPPLLIPNGVCHLVLMKILTYTEKHLGFEKRRGIVVSCNDLPVQFSIHVCKPLTQEENKNSPLYPTPMSKAEIDP